MKVLLVKCHKKTLFSKLEPIVTEPLELEYLSTLLTELKIQHKIYDPLLEGNNFKKVISNYLPDVLILTGYITAVGEIIRFSQYTKEKYPTVKVIVGGVHAEVNFEDFFVDTIDYIVHSDGINTLKELIKSEFSLNKVVEIRGIAFNDGGQWRVNEKIATCIEKIPLPDRSYFIKYKNRTKYMNYSPMAIVKTALSCPFNCHFCYCKQLNMGQYATRSIESVVEEISEIDSPYIWIVDDSFLIDRQRILEFINEIKRKEVNKKFVAYSRVDFIANNEDLIGELAGIGLIELIVGMEAVEDDLLKDFNKNSSIHENTKTVEVLKRNGILLTALFITGIDFTTKDFKKMRRWIREMGLKSYTASIFTPIKGTALYNEYENKITTKDFSKFDFLNLTLPPVHMSNLHYYFQFYMIYIEQFFRSKYIRGFVINQLKNIFKFGGQHD